MAPLIDTRINAEKYLKRIKYKKIILFISQYKDLKFFQIKL